MQSESRVVALVATGGTIAGTAARGDDLVGYDAGALSAEQLTAAVPALAGEALETWTLARLDSCDLGHATWALLLRELQSRLARPEFAGIVVTHGTDTLEETAWFLHRTLAAPKPVVLTAAMRPASAPSPDGPQNLLDAVRLAREPGARGVLVAFGGKVYAGSELRKLHGWQLDAFSAGDAGAVALVEDGAFRRLRDWPAPELHPAPVGEVPPGRWPRVEIVTSHAGASGRIVDALVADGVQGLVIAGTGNGTVHTALREAAARALAAGVAVVRASRCLAGGVVGTTDGALPHYGAATPAQARIELMLDLLARRA
ncbi:asparaginase [Rubrivivax gelatinosus]|uniref:L-asparaginase, type II AnsB n=1 Tax=Rubrivivax gelatinosus (strain NBRC 100245 / IL144) TaxID=983917 RepID=I0HRV2_RUBGI|nr:asparaginase [Rubrivivax gelatinosus]BAL95739.1 L-asparaginase, type II AnsB [Rubrivivax gelatinosus IL144]